MLSLSVHRRFLIELPFALEAELCDVLDVPIVDVRHVLRAFDFRSELPLAIQAFVRHRPSSHQLLSIALRDVIAQNNSASEEAPAALRAQVTAFAAAHHQSRFPVHVNHLVFPQQRSVAPHLTANRAVEIQIKN